MVEVSPGLLIGSESDAQAVISRQRSITKRHAVTHILSVINEPPDWLNPDQSATPCDQKDEMTAVEQEGGGVVAVEQEGSEGGGVVRNHKRVASLFIQATDEPKTDLLNHFEQCCQFIQGGVQQGTVLVHCVYGISRSATVVLAYLMWKEGRPLHIVQKEVLTKKPDIRPNSGFMEQLKLWGVMRCRIDTSNKQYKGYRLRVMADTLNFQDSSCAEEVKNASSVDPSVQVVDSSAYYRCRKCRRMLFTDESVLLHTLGKGQAAFKWHKRSKVPHAPYDPNTTPTPEQVTQDPSNSNKTCSSFFVEPVEWMEEVIVGNVEGKILCPKCQSRLGSFSWSGHQCSCGQWVNPSFQIHKAKVDEITTLSRRKNSQTQNQD